MSQQTGLAMWDWVIVAGFLAVVVLVGLYFTRRAGKDIQAFFVSGRSLSWFVVATSLIATNFASDTPLWVSSLVRRYGIHAVWQYWAPLLGCCFCAVLFARLWRRMNVLTDIEFLELRYSGGAAAVLRFWLGTAGALLMCPLIISWVTKAMVTIASEAMGISQEYLIYATVGTLVVAVLTCAFSGLYGVVYSDLFLFFVAVIGVVLLAVFSVLRVGGLESMIEQLRALDTWPGRDLAIAPSLGPSAEGKMSIWNMIGYFVFFWIGNAVSARFSTQRLLACKDTRHASYAQIAYTIFYFGFLAWPWVVVGLCSLIVFPDLGAGVSPDHAYPRMIVTVLPIGLRGMLVAAMIAAYVSTINTLFNWGSSYIVNDVYKRFLFRRGSDSHYVWVARAATVFLAALGGFISTMAPSIQSLLEIFYIVGPTMAVVELLRWLWPRLTAIGELAASVTTWAGAMLMIAGVFNRPVQMLFGFPSDFQFNKSYDYLGARILMMAVMAVIAAVIGSLLSPPTRREVLVRFVEQAKPIRFFWRSVIRDGGLDYQPVDTFRRTLISWALAVIAVLSLLVGVGQFVLARPLIGVGCLMLSCVTLILTARRAKADHHREMAVANSGDARSGSER